MSDSLFSPLWYRVAALKPALRTHIELHRHDYRGLIWYILEDKSSGRHHRFCTAAYQVIGLMNGERSVDQIWDAVNVKLGDYAPTQDEVIQLLGQLHAADLLHCEVLPDTEELFERQQQRKTSKIKRIFGNPLSQKIPLWDPDDFLNLLLPWVRWLYHWATGLVWFLVVSLAALLANLYWEGLTANLTVHSLSPYNFTVLCLVYPIIKLLHELGHAFAVKVEGGEVHEMGVLFMVFIPIPYVNVSSSLSFRSKHKRMLVAAAGIIVELFLAALGVFLWLCVETSVVREVAFSVVLIGGISSLFFNGNPLLKYDGYYVLADALEIPNLYQRSTQYLKFLCQGYLFGVKGLVSPASAPGEARWFFVYGFASVLYRIAILWVIIILVTDKLFVVGVLLTIWLLTLQIFLPVAKGVKFIATSPGLERRRVRAVCITIGIIGIFLVSILVIPFPSFTLAEGVVRPPEEAHLRAGTDGVITKLLAIPDREVALGTPLVQLEDPLLKARVKILQSKLRGLNVQYHGYWFENHVQAEIVKEEMAAISADLKNARDKERATVIRSPKAGKLLIPIPADQPGRFVRHGELIGYIIDDSKPTARVLVTQSDIGRVRERVVGIEVRVANHLAQVLHAKVLREVPEGTNKLQSAALSSTGGGLLAVDPTQQDGLMTLEKIFQFDIAFSPSFQQVPTGTRVYVRFDHGSEPLARQWYRRIRQLFLRQFNV